MADYKALAGAVSDLARALVDPHRGISDLLHDLTEQVSGVLGLLGATVAMEDAGRLRYVAAVDERSAALGRIEEREQAGPGVDAWRDGKVVAVVDLRSSDQSWNGFALAAVNAGIVSVAAIPMGVGGNRIGALVLFCANPTDWPLEDLAAAGVLADLSASHVIQASELNRQRRTSEQLQEALHTRVIIEQAKGVLAAEGGVSVDEGFERLRRYARDHNTNLRLVADRVVNRGLRP